MQRVARLGAPPGSVIRSRTELDSHADTTALGRNAVVLEYTDRECTVSPYAETYDAIPQVPIVRGATGITRVDGSKCILVFNEALWLANHMEHPLLNPNQLRAYGCKVYDNPFDTEPMRIESRDGMYRFGLRSSGTTIYMDTWTPTDEDLNSLPHIVLTSDQHWNPQSVEFPKNSLAVEEEIERQVEDVRTLREADVCLTTDQDCYEDRDDNDDTNQTVFENIDLINKRLIEAVKVQQSPSPEESRRTISQVNRDEHDEVQEGLPKLYRTSGKRKSTVTAEKLAKLWDISFEKARNTIRKTTQHFVRSAVMPLSRRFKADRFFKRPKFNATVFTDTIDGRVKTIEGNRYAQLFTTAEWFADIYPMSSKAKAGKALGSFINDYGVMTELVSDGGGEQVGHRTQFQDYVDKFDIRHTLTEPGRSNQNRAEGVVNELRKRWFRVMVRKRVPRRLWDYGFKWICKTMQLTALHTSTLDGITPLQFVTGETPDISQYAEIGFYDWVKYQENAGAGPEKIGRWLGVSENIGSMMSCWILPESGTPVSRVTLRPMTFLELNTDEAKQACRSFDERIKERYKDDYIIDEDGRIDPDHWADLMHSDPSFREEFQRIIEDTSVPEADDLLKNDPFGDNYLSMEISMPRGPDGEPMHGKVTKRLRDRDGYPIGTASENPMLDSRMYEVEYQDGQRESLTANQIAEAMFAEVDAEGQRHVLFQDIQDHRTDGTELVGDEGFFTTRNGTRRRKPTTKGHQILIGWKDGSTTWHKLKDVKEAFPVQLAEYAVQNRLVHLPAFAWWVRDVLKKRNRIIAKVKSKYWIRTHKYGIRIPKNYQEAIDIDAENHNTLWQDAIRKEMAKAIPAFEEWDGNIEDLPPGYQEIKCHLVFDVKLGENFRRKARYVAGGHMTEAPSSITYSSVVSRDSVRICLMAAALNGLDVLACDIENAYLTADCREKIFVQAGPEFGPDKGKIMLVKKALYGLKSSGAAFRALCSSVLRDLGYTPTKGDPDVYIRKAVKPDGFEYYEMALVYVDDILVVSHEPMKTMDGIRAKFTLKGDKAEVPTDYLGAVLEKKSNDYGEEVWYISAEKYVKAAVKNVEEKLAKAGERLPGKCRSPLPDKYQPGLDTSKELDAQGLQFYQEMIGVLRWACELGRIDILLETSIMSTCLACPRVGHLQQLYRMFGYLKEHTGRKIAMDARMPNVSEDRFKSFDWEDFYPDAKEQLPPDAPEPLGNPVEIHCFVDAGHANDKANRRSQTGVLIFCNRAPIIWFSKRQNSVETSTFGSELTAMKTAAEMIQALRYKLRMFGFPTEKPASVYCDNDAVTKIAVPESTLRARHHSISYHYCRELVAAKVIRIAKEPTGTNISDPLTKLMPSYVRDKLYDRFMY